MGSTHFLKKDWVIELATEAERASVEGITHKTVGVLGESRRLGV